MKRAQVQSKDHTHNREADQTGSTDAAVSKQLPTAAQDNAAAEPEAGVQPEETVESLRAQVEELQDKLLRTKADFQNRQRRLEVERSEAIRYANAELMRSLLGVLDDFERSLAAADQSENLAAVVEGAHLVYENLLKALRENGLEPIDAHQEPFDPNVHEALLQQPTNEHPPGTVVEQIARGYRLSDRVLRPAKVVVAKAPDEAAGGSNTGREELPGQ